MSEPALPIERSPERDSLLRAAVPHAAALGWRGALERALRDSGEPPSSLRALFPGGAAGAVEAWCDLADRDMADAAPPGLEAMRIPARIRALLALRLRQAAPQRDAVRRGLALLSLPWHAAAAARSAARTADAVWRAAGDRSEGTSRHTRRATLAALYVSVLLFWLTDGSEDQANTLGFLDRQLQRLGRATRRRRPA